MKNHYIYQYYQMFFMITVFFTGCHVSSQHQHFWKTQKEGSLEFKSDEYSRKARYTLYFNDKEYYQLVLKFRFVPKIVAIKSPEGLFVTQGSQSYSILELTEISNRYFGGASFDDIVFYLQEGQIPPMFVIEDSAKGKVLRQRAGQFSLIIS